MTHSPQETEIKLAVPDPRTARRLLGKANFTVSRRRVFESNVILDTPRLTLRRASTLLRLRQAGHLTTVTYKGKPAVAKFKTREELELPVADAPVMQAIFQRLGFHPVFRYEKYRTEYRQSRGAGMATLDETPVGVYLELEGPPRWIDRTARQLGFGERDYITDSYARLYLNWCRENRVQPSNMVFPTGSSGSAAGRRSG
jgi:adenylate cyclase class 2